MCFANNNLTNVSSYTVTHCIRNGHISPEDMYVIRLFLTLQLTVVSLVKLLIANYMEFTIDIIIITLQYHT